VELRVRGRQQWNPTSREKRARCGPPVSGLRGRVLQQVTG
jgi:hypothetical protein